MHWEKEWLDRLFVVFIKGLGGEHILAILSFRRTRNSGRLQNSPPREETSGFCVLKPIDGGAAV